MEYLDKFLKKLKTDRNTFFCYILTLISFYLCIDRIVEVIFIAATGMYVDLWGPIAYTLATLCLSFAYHFSSSSKFKSSNRIKLTFLYAYLIGIYILFSSLIIQWVNALSWILLFCVPNYSEIITDFRDLVKPAFSGFAWYLPITTFYKLFIKIHTEIHDIKEYRDAVFDYAGIDLTNKKNGWGPYTCEMFICKDGETGKSIKIPESRRFESTLVVGVSGSGKTSMIFEPMIARDIEKKAFFRESEKEMGYTALKTGLAYLDSPYSNEYLNKNFDLSMLKVKESKEKLYNAYMQKLILSKDHEKFVYKDIGLTYVAPDFETLDKMMEVARNFNVPYKLIDPSDPKSYGINPFVYKDPVKTSIAISSVLKIMFSQEVENNSHAVTDTYLQNVAVQAIENLTILLYEMYPLEHDDSDELPNLNDLLKLLYDFDEIERLAEKMQSIPELAEKYMLQLKYIKSTFYKSAPKRDETQKEVLTLTTQLAELLRYPGVQNIICNRERNINYDDVLKNGEFIFVCTRRGDLGKSIHKAFGTFFLLLMQHSVLSRPGNEKTRVPHFLYIDEFPEFLSRATSAIFTLYRKYRVGTTISAQNLSQFGTVNGDNFRQTLLANCTTKMVFGNNTPEDNAWWQKEFGDKREWKAKRDYQPQGLMDNTETIRKIVETDNPNGSYTSTLKDITYAWVENYAAGKIQALKFKEIIYKTKDLKGKNLVGKARVDFLDERYSNEQPEKTFNFAKFAKNSIENASDDENEKKPKFSLKNISFNGTSSNPNDSDPIQSNTTDLNYKFDNEDAITNYGKFNKKDN